MAWYGFTTGKDLRIGRRLCEALDGGADPPDGMVDQIRMIVWRERNEKEIERAVRWCEAVVEYAKALEGLHSDDKRDEGEGW
jgi:hypothetical protein